MKEETKIRYCPNCGVHGPKKHEHPYGSQDCLFVCPKCPDKGWREWPDKDCVRNSHAVYRWAASGEDLTDDEVAEYYRTTMKDDVSEEDRLYCLNHYLERKREKEEQYEKYGV